MIYIYLKNTFSIHCIDSQSDKNAIFLCCHQNYLELNSEICVANAQNVEIGCNAPKNEALPLDQLRWNGLECLNGPKFCFRGLKNAYFHFFYEYENIILNFCNL